MKSPRVLLASLLAFTLGTPDAHSQTAFNSSTPNINPGIEECCACVSWSVMGDLYAESGKNLQLRNDKDGNYWFSVQVKFPENQDCDSSYAYTIKAMPIGVDDKSIYKTGTISRGSSVIRYFKLDASTARFGDTWIISFACKKGDDSPDQPFPATGTVLPRTCDQIVTFTLGGCESCAMQCKQTGAPSMSNDPFSINIPTTQSFGGDVSGSISYHTSTFTNPGLSALSSAYSPDIQVNFGGGGLMSSVQTGANSMDFAPASPALVALDPNAFQVTHKDPSGTAFRTTTIAMIPDGGTSYLRMDSTFEGSTIRHQRSNPSPNVFVMEKGRVVSGVFHALSRETLTITNPSPIKRIKRTLIQERPNSTADWQAVSDTISEFDLQYGGWLQTKEIVDPDGAALTSTWTYYQPGEVTGPNGSTKGLGRIKQHVRHDGYQAFYTYSHNKDTVTTPYGSDPAGKVETTEWDPGTQTRTQTTTVAGQMVSKSVTIHSPTTETNTTYTSATGTLTTTTTYTPAGQDFGGKPVKVQHPDGTLTTYSYTRHAGGGYTTITDKGSTSNGNTVTKGTRTITTTNSRGTTILSKEEAIGCGTGSAAFSYMVVTSVDHLGRSLSNAIFPSNIELLNEYYQATGAAWVTTTEYICCGVSKETDMYGIPTYYAYDEIERQIKTNRLGVTTETVRKGLVTESHRYPESVEESLSPASLASDANLVSRSVTNLAGTLQESWSPDPTSATPGALVKSSSSETTYKPAAGLSTRTVTTVPGGHSQTTDSFLDGRTAATYGALSPAMSYSYAVNATGEVSTQSYVDGINLRETTTTQTDWAGRSICVSYPDGAFATTTYNSLGQVISSTEPHFASDADFVISLYAYNPEGERTISATDLNHNGTIDYGVDTVSFSKVEYALEGGNPVITTISKVWQPGDTSPTGGTVVSTRIRTANGLSSASQSLGVANASTNATVLGGSGNWTSTSTAPDGTKQVQTYTGGLLVSSSYLKTDNSALHTTTYGYDSLNRRITFTDSRTGATTTTYFSTTNDTVASVTDPGNRTTYFTYDARGRRVSVNAPNSLDADGNTLANVTNIIYNPNSTAAETTGDQIYRTTYTYDYAQRQVTMTTYGTTTATTYWHYSHTRGFLTRKAYHDGKGTDYTYTAAGRLSTRAWAREVGTSYIYDKGGRLVSTTYSDDTPDVTVVHDCLGRQISQTNGIATTTYAYDPATLALDTETIAYNLDGQPGADFTRVIDRSRDSLQRDSGWTLSAPASASLDNQVTYTYGPTDGRLATVANGTDSFMYGYLANSNLLSTVTGPAHTVTNTWEATRDVLASKENKVGTTVISGYTYNVNHLGQRTGVSTAGTALAASGSIDWGYNSKGEVVKADSSVNANDRAYQYDGIGNRLKSADSLTLPVSNNYTPNALNQYTAIDSLNPGYDDDGNITTGPLPANTSANGTLAWDAENRLVSTTVNSVTTTYLYDSKSRRIAQTTGSNTTVYVYDGWNPIAEFVSSTLTKSYTWGMDLSGSMQGVGGVGGLLAVTNGAGSFFPTYDGNGNISEYLDLTGAIAAHYEYDPFGKETVANGATPGGFAHRFSTKPLDPTTGLYYYGYRYYDPINGRWPSRDPLEEKGGINIYGFVNNNGMNRLDKLGMRPDGVPDGAVEIFVSAEWWDDDGGPGAGNGVGVYDERLSYVETSVWAWCECTLFAKRGKSTDEKHQLTWWGQTKSKAWSDMEPKGGQKMYAQFNSEITTEGGNESTSMAAVGIGAIVGGYCGKDPWVSLGAAYGMWYLEKMLNEIGDGHGAFQTSAIVTCPPCDKKKTDKIEKPKVSWGRIDGAIVRSTGSHRGGYHDGVVPNEEYAPGQRIRREVR